MRRFDSGRRLLCCTAFLPRRVLLGCGGMPCPVRRPESVFQPAAHRSGRAWRVALTSDRSLSGGAPPPRRAVLVVSCLGALLAIVGVVGCGGCGPAQMGDPGAGGSAANTGAQHRQPESTEATGTTAADTNVSVRLAGPRDFAQVLAAQRGKVVLVDFWATWCPSCVAQFHHTVAMHDRYGPQGLAVVSVSMDDADAIDRVRDFLARQHAVFVNLLARGGSSDAAFSAFELNGLPEYRIYDRGGSLRRRFAVDPQAARPFTSQDIERAVEKFLTEGSP